DRAVSRREGFPRDRGAHPDGGPDASGSPLWQADRCSSAGVVSQGKRNSLATSREEALLWGTTERLCWGCSEVLDMRTWISRFVLLGCAVVSLRCGSEEQDPFGETGGTGNDAGAAGSTSGGAAGSGNASSGGSAGAGAAS